MGTSMTVLRTVSPWADARNGLDKAVNAIAERTQSKNENGVFIVPSLSWSSLLG
jgi:hypothetical protein